MSKKTHLNKWWQILLFSEQAEERSYSLWEIPNVAGVQILNSKNIICTFQAQSLNTNELSTQFQNAGFKICEIKLIEDINWVQKCEELWETIEVGKFKLEPSLSPKDTIPSPEENIIRIIPGLGFGTGHHSSTQIALEFICDLYNASIVPSRILDLGTGSGILAIAAHKLWPTDIIAVDNDTYALINARENIALNCLDEKITLMHGDIKLLSDKFDLIIANIYAEVLVSLEVDFRSRLSMGGYLILSGIMPNRINEINSEYSTNNWQSINQVVRESWCGILFKKIGE